MEKNAGVVLLETELRLGIPGAGAGEIEVKKKRGFYEICGIGDDQEKEVVGAAIGNGNGAKNQIVGWPPVRRKNVGGGKGYVKVSMDGAPYLRKIDFGSYGGYAQLVTALEELFATRFGFGDEETKLDDKISQCDVPIIYEDKDGDWMLLGDVPWVMFRESCKRLRIMKKVDGDDEDNINHATRDLLKGLSKMED